MTDHKPDTRTQMSLSVPSHSAANLEAARRLLDPEQSRLIAAHVTLCREDELAQVSGPMLEMRLTDTRLEPLTLHFGGPEVFDGHGLCLRCMGGEKEFRALRQHVLGSRNIRQEAPHITLAHPRNPKSPGNSPANTGDFPQLSSITFHSVCLIEQQGRAPWKLLREFRLRCS
jgi:2'-5' RNA ligase